MRVDTISRDALGCRSWLDLFAPLWRLLRLACVAGREAGADWSDAVSAWLFVDATLLDAIGDCSGAEAVVIEAGLCAGC